MKSLIPAALLLMVCTSFASASDLAGTRFLKISAYDQMAVIKTVSGEMKTVGVGYQIEPNKTISEIAENQVVIETEGINGPEKLIVQLDKDGKQKIDRMGATLTNSKNK